MGLLFHWYHKSTTPLRLTSLWRYNTYKRAMDILAIFTITGNKHIEQAKIEFWLKKKTKTKKQKTKNKKQKNKKTKTKT